MMLSVRLRHQMGAFALDVDFQAPSGITVLFGRSGSGKTSIVNAVAGLLTPQEGRITLEDQVFLDTANGVNPPPHKRRVGYVFQEARLFPHLTVRQNLAYGRLFAPRDTARDDPEKVIDMLGLGPLLKRRPGRLSGGERQRVAIGRALLSAPRLILADEPLAALDDARKAEILPYFERLRDEISIPVLYVSHSAAEVARLATTVVAIDAGRVTRLGPASDVLADPMVTPAGVRAAGAVITARIRGHHDDGITELEAGGVPLFVPKVAQPPGAQIRLRIAAQEVVLSRKPPQGLSALNIIPGVVDRVRSGDGPGALVSLKTPAGPVLARVTRRSVQALDLREGVTCHAIVKSVAIAPEDVGRARVAIDS